MMDLGVDRCCLPPLLGDSSENFVNDYWDEEVVKKFVVDVIFDELFVVVVA